MIGLDAAAQEAIRRRPDYSFFDFGNSLPPGSLENARMKFSQRRQGDVLEEIVKELDDGTLYLGDWTLGEIEIIGINTIAQNRFWSEVEYKVLFPPKNGSTPVEGFYRCIRWNAGIIPGASALCITTSNEVVLLKSFRHAARRWALELPRGAIAPGEDAEQCAWREAQEETGVIRTSSSVAYELGSIEPDTGILMTQPKIFLLKNVEVDVVKVNRDLTESVMGPVIMSLKEFKGRIASNEIKDSFALSALCMSQARGLLS